MHSVQNTSNLEDNKQSPVSEIEQPQIDNGHDRFINKPCKAYYLYVYSKILSLTPRSDSAYPPGTPRLAAFQSKADSVAIWRRFSRVHCRLLLRLESRITDLETKLDMLDETDAETDMKYRFARKDWDKDKDWDRTQEDLLEELQTKVLQYGRSLWN